VPSELHLRLALLIGSAVGGLLVTPGLIAGLRRLALERTNYSGAPLCTGGGLLFLVSLAPWAFFTDDRAARALAAGAAVFGLLGLVDDRFGTREFKGLKGHLRALGRGRVTTGLLKAVGGVVAAVGVAFWLQTGIDAVLAALLIALSANALNLLDLRPLRALKVFWLLSLPLLLTAPLPLVQLAGIAAGYAPAEAKRRVMLGDTGSNLLGCALGVALALSLPIPGLAVAVGLLVLLHAWTERHSITEWLAAHPWADRLDRWGWSDRQD
jgi:UDP-GlcNAc:undecaprenyl-phosphate GlcNAc-1-phosphate transferase